MRQKWTGNLIGRMHNEGITQEDLANELGVTKAYISMILNNRRCPPDAKQRLEDAFTAAKNKKSRSE